MKIKYNTFDFWEKYIEKNRTIRGRMFIDEAITQKTVYFHTIVFTKQSGITSMWGPVPNKRMLLGYIENSFLPEAFYKWVYGKNKNVSRVPVKPAIEIIGDCLNANMISKDEAKIMKEQADKINAMWDLPNDNLMNELKKFTREFNKKWFGDNTEFLYLKVFNDASELGEFVVKTYLMTEKESNFKNDIGISKEKWLEICNNIEKNSDYVQTFKYILTKKLNNIL